VSGGAPDCPVRPSPATFTNGYGSGLGAINTPNHIIHIHPSIVNIPFIARAKRLLSYTHSIDQILSKPPNQLISIRDLREGVLCSFVALVAWIGIFLFPFLFSSAL
jgi:hypothetical protein